MSWSEAEVETILELMRGGASVMSGGSRCHSTWFFRDGEWICEDFDEGYTQERPSSEATIRAMIIESPERFRGVLKAPRWQRFSAAFLANDPQARALLREALEYGDRHDHGKILDAVLAWPEHPPSAEVVALIKDKVSGSTAYHVFMDAARWDRSEATGQKGVAFVERLIAMVGEIPAMYSLRASFHEQAGDLAAAESDLTRELERTPPDDYRRPSYEQSLARLRRA